MESKLITDKHGNKTWRLPNYLLHKEDGPAIDSIDGTKFWYKNGKFHRENGPALDFPSGYKEWHLNGIRYKNEQKWKKEIRKLKLDRILNIENDP